jgi:ABC-type nickel/cobalt efflux system permease component RcnA
MINAELPKLKREDYLFIGRETQTRSTRCDATVGAWALDDNTLIDWDGRMNPELYTHTHTHTHTHPHTQNKTQRTHAHTHKHAGKLSNPVHNSPMGKVLGGESIKAAVN